jgi:hypothetical protein
MKNTETKEETLERLAQDAHTGAKAAKRFKALVRVAARAPKSEIGQRAQQATPE